MTRPLLIDLSSIWKDTQVLINENCSADCRETPNNDFIIYLYYPWVGTK